MGGFYLSIIPAVFVIMTVGGFLSMWSDKKRAETGARRIPEWALFLIAFCLGGLGSMLGMFICRHKTQHWYFLVFMPILALWSVAATVVSEVFLLIYLMSIAVIEGLSNSLQQGTTAALIATLAAIR